LLDRRHPQAAIAAESLAYLDGLFSEYRHDPDAVGAELGRYFAALAGEGTALRCEEEAAPAPEAHPPIAPRAAPSGAVRPTEPATEHAALLRRCPLFAALSDSDLAHVSALAERLTVDAGEPVCLEGETGDCLYVIAEGTALVRRRGRVLAERGPGEVVGELAVLDKQPRSADVVAHERTTLVRVRGENFRRLLARRTDLALRLLRVLSARVRGHSTRQEQVDRLVRAYRERGHIIANLDPLGRRSRTHPTLELGYFHLGEEDLDSVFSVRLGRKSSLRTLRQILASLQRTYCAEVGVQYTHIDDLDIQRWLRLRIEENENRRSLSGAEQRRILTKLTQAELFESFVHRKFAGAKRFSLEGAESLIPLLDHAIEAAAAHGVREVVMGMAHRGRLNVLANILNKPAWRIFREFADEEPDDEHAAGDVKYHLGHSCDRSAACGQRIHLSLSFNPSHLEFIDPVVAGRARAKQDRLADTDRSRVMPILIHGDAAFTGQGVVQEMLNMSELPGYRVGGTIHIVLNNHIGFTTLPEQGRSSDYATDVARMLQVPILHVNGEHPEAVHQVIHLAMAFRARFKKDVVIDMHCYRRYGHNEGDDPTFTQPLLYRRIDKRRPVRAAYVENLLSLGGVTREVAEAIATRERERLEADLDTARNGRGSEAAAASARGIWQAYLRPSGRVPTGVAPARLRRLLASLASLPEDFRPHRRLTRFLEARRAMARGEEPLDWSAAEALAFASLLEEGCRVRLTGQDCERGTFSQRHAVCHDVENGRTYVPLAQVSEQQAPFEVYNSPLSEVGALGFEYGYSLDYPDALIVWEAQFGDFCNAAQVIVDQFIASAERKWRRLSGLCLLLPHGFDGQGPEHSSARLERFLSLAAEDNLCVINPTTPAQMFHALRRQVLETPRKPLVVLSPKALLRHRSVRSALEEFAREGRFRPVLGDRAMRRRAVRRRRLRRAVLCSGKLSHELEAERRRRGLDEVTIIRLEQYYPFPEGELLEALERLPRGTELCWAQEEPLNMGAWPYLQTTVAERLGAHDRPIDTVVGRPRSASPATGSAAVHQREQQALVSRALGPAAGRGLACNFVSGGPV